jgi:hypothetical protein
MAIVASALLVSDCQQYVYLRATKTIKYLSVPTIV